MSLTYDRFQVIPVDPSDQVVRLASTAQRVVVLTGAGMSAESGVPTFRDAQTGLWEKYDVTALASPQAWDDDPALVWSWYRWRAELVEQAQPNAGHHALARWAQRADVRVVTQNVDDLHERAGSTGVEHLHGSLFAPRCSECSTPTASATDPDLPYCPSCSGLVRPGVVWFGEALPTGPWDAAVAAVEDCDLVVVVGTSGVVYPAAGLPSIARAAGVPTIEINPAYTDLTDQVDHSWRTTAAEGLPLLSDL